MKKLLFLKLIFILLLSLTQSNASNLNEKLAFRISNFIKFKSLNETFNMCVFNSNKSFQEMNKLAKESTISKLPVSVSHLQSFEDYLNTSCQVIYFSDKINYYSNQILEDVLNKEIFTITTKKNDVYDKVHFGIYSKNNKMKFVINRKLMNHINVNYRILNRSEDLSKGYN